MLLKCYAQYASKFGKPAVATGLGNVNFHSSLKKGNAKECSNYCTTVVISYASKLTLKVLQGRL